MKQVFFILIFLVCIQIKAQKIVEKQLNASAISVVEVQGNQMFKIAVETVKEKSITLVAKIEGEHSEHVVISVTERNKTVYITSRFQPLFKSKNDKLSVHKRISIEITLKIPEHLQLAIVSDIASAKIKGDYQHVMIQLVNGNCRMNPFRGNATIKTIHGSIIVNSDYASVKAKTKNGKLIQEKLLQGKNILNLNSINGNITVTKIK